MLRVPHFYCKYFTNGQKNTHIENWCKYWTTEKNTNKIMVAHFRWKFPYFGGEYRWFSFFLVVFIDLIRPPVPSVVDGVDPGGNDPRRPRPSRNCPAGEVSVSWFPSDILVALESLQASNKHLGALEVYTTGPPKKHTNFKTPNQPKLRYDWKTIGKKHPPMLRIFFR